MSYVIELRRQALEQLGKMNRHDRDSVLVALSVLETQPRSSSVIKLSGYDLWRVRVGDFRIIYSIDDSANMVIVRRLIHRNEGTYKNL
jgi:mRNA interferase RelE/StbE